MPGTERVEKPGSKKSYEIKSNFSGKLLKKFYERAAWYWIDFAFLAEASIINSSK